MRITGRYSLRILSEASGSLVKDFNSISPFSISLLIGITETISSEFFITISTNLGLSLVFLAILKAFSDALTSLILTTLPRHFDMSLSVITTIS